MPSSSMYLGRISSPRLKILPLGLEILFLFQHDYSLHQVRLTSLVQYIDR